MILKGPEPDPNPTLFTTFYFSRGIKASISYHKIDAIIHTEKKLQQQSYLCLFGENWPWHIRNVGCHTQLGKPTQTHHTTQTTQNQS